MMQRLLSTAAILVLFFAVDGSVNSCLAQRPRLFFQPRMRMQHAYQVAPRAMTYDERYRYLNWRYPKYTGAFHASYFQSIGVSSGDIGFRGNGVYPTPW